VRDTFGAAVVAALIALALAFGAQRGKQAAPAVSRSGDVTNLASAVARYTLHPTSGRVEIATVDGKSRLDVELSLVIDGAERPLAMRRSDLHLRDKNTIVGELPIEIGEEHASGTFELRMDPSGDLVSASLVMAQDKGSTPHSYALRANLAPEGRSVFVPGVGEVVAVEAVEARTVSVDDDLHPFAFVSAQGPLSITDEEPTTDEPGARPRFVISSKSESTPKRVDLGIVVGASSQQLWGRLYRVLRQPVSRVVGVVTGTKERAHVVALDEEGKPLVRVVTDPQGHFALEAPDGALQWYAALEAVSTSVPARFVPGTPWELKLDVSAGGELAVKIVDYDTKQPLVARLWVKGIAGTLDPTFGPDYRASGAGPLMDVLEGEVRTGLPAGKYRVAATKGIEYSIDAEEIEIDSGKTKSLELALRHVVPTPGMVGCDLHVHARPSFDSPVTPEDRVLSLVSAGVDFAVPTEHNVTGDYTPAVDLLKLGKSLAHVNGVEVTTFNPRFGHFGVFPWTGTSVPPYRGTSAAAIIGATRRAGGDRIVQVNHPRLPSSIGYFQLSGFDPKSGRVPGGMRTDFDTIEVYNGYDIGNRARVEQVMEDWYALLNFGKHIAATGSSDSHRIQYQWAGYPRTYALVDPKAGGDTGQPIDTREVVLALKKGRSLVTSGPLIELELGGKAHPGDELRTSGGPVPGKLRVRAAPWVDVTAVVILAGVPGPRDPAAAGTIVRVFDKTLESVPTKLGDEDGTLADASARTIRLDETLSLDLPEGTRWVLAVAKGDRRIDDALPFMPFQPMGFTNPIWIAR
jgi:hypothetical protein